MNRQILLIFLVIVYYRFFRYVVNKYGKEEKET